MLYNLTHNLSPILTKEDRKIVGENVFTEKLKFKVFPFLKGEWGCAILFHIHGNANKKHGYEKELIYMLLNMYYGGYGMGYYWDPTYILVLIGVIITMAASAGVNSTYSKYSRVRSMSGMTGAEAAQRILTSAGLSHVRVEHIAGNLTDHYDPRSKVLRLSDSVYGSASVAAIGVAAHECGHAIQDQKDYAPLKMRGAFVPVANFGSKAAWPLIIIGLILGSNSVLIELGILCFSLAVLFQIITLPVEFNASRRAIRILGDTGMLRQDELSHTKKVLTAAALTYVASAASAILSLLRLILLFGRRNND